MEFAYDISGGTPIVRRYPVGATSLIAGIPVLVAGAGDPGVIATAVGTSAIANVVGLTIDAATQTIPAAQTSPMSDPQRYVSVIVNPYAVYRARLSGSATAGVALAEHSVTTASSDGLTITTNTAWNSPTYDELAVWGYLGANAGIVRKVDTVSATAATVEIALPADTVVGDTFLRAQISPVPAAAGVRLTTNFAEIDAITGSAHADTFRVVDVDLRSVADAGTLNSFAYIVPLDHYLAA